MSVGGAFVNGLVGGLHAGQKFSNYLDEERDEEREEQMSLEAFQTNKKRSEILFDQGQEEVKLQRKDRVRQIARQEDLDAMAKEKAQREADNQERRLKIAELSSEQQRRIADAQVNNNLSQQQVAQLEIKQLQQHEKAKQAQQLAAQSSQLMQSGNLKQGLDLYRQLDDLGFGTKEIIEGKYTAQEAEDVIGSLMSGELPLDSKEARSLTSKLLKPSFINSGRDLDKYEPAGIRESRPGFFAIELRDKKTGKIVPATHFQSDDGKDPITEVSMESLMQGATSWLQMAREIEAGRDALEAQKQIAGLQARFRSEKPGVSSPGEGGDDDVMPKNQQAFIALLPTEGEQNLAKLLIAEDGFDDQLKPKMQRIQKIATDEGLSLSDAVLEFRQESEIERNVAERTVKLEQQGADSRKAEKLVKRLVAGSITREQYEREARKLIEGKDKPAEPAAAPALSRRYQ